MKPYGYTGVGKSRLWDLGYEDVLAIQIGGRKSSVGKLPEKCGKYKSYTRSTKSRRAVRRYFKKAFRQKLKQAMTKQFVDLAGDPFIVDFVEHDISMYLRLYHITPKENKESILEKGLLINQPRYKSMIDTGMLFFSYPILDNTSDLFRFHEETQCIVLVRVPMLLKAGYIFYDDYFGIQDQSSNRNHICCTKSIPKEYIIKIIEV